MGHETIISQFVISFVSTVAAAFAFYFYRKTGLNYVKYFAYLQATRFLVSASRFVFYYIMKNTDSTNLVCDYHLGQLYQIYSYLLTFLTIYLFIKTFLALLGIRKSWLAPFTVLYSGITLFMIVYDLLHQMTAPPGYTMYYVWFMCVWYALVIFVVLPALLIWRVRSFKKNSRNRALFEIGIFFLFIGLIYLVVTALHTSDVISNPLLRIIYDIIGLTRDIVPTLFIGKMISMLESGKEENAGVNGELLKKSALSNREQDVLNLICQGKSNQEIGDELCISIQTVKSHIHNILTKTNLRNRIQLMKMFYQNGENGESD